MADLSRFDELKERATRGWDALWQGDRTVVTVNVHGGSIPSGAEDVYQGLRYEIEMRGLPVTLRQTGSLGFEFAEPVVQVKRPGAPTVVYGEVSPDDVRELVARAIDGQGVWREKALGFIGEEGLAAELPKPAEPTPATDRPGDYQGIPPLKEHPFMRRQSRLLMRRWGLIDPDSLEEYVATGGYAGYVKALSEMTQDQVIEEIKISNVRGRGGAGFQMGIKWESGRASRGYPKYVICNGHEGEPNVFKDRRTFESDPHSVLEGIIIGCYAVGASIGYAFIGGEFPLGIKRFKRAIKEAEAAGLLGENILGTGFNCEVRVRIGGGAYISGEGSALIYSVQGDRPQPRTKPPRSVEYGLWGKPTVVNNVETLANAPDIVIRGGAWFKSIGPEHSTGTKLFTLAGPIKYTGVAETVMDLSTRELIDEVYGGMREGSTFKGFQTGGVSGACMTEDQLHLNVDFESLDEVGGMLGSAGFIVLDQHSCAVDWARYLMKFNADESCGKCTPCRLGCPSLTEVLDRIRYGSGLESDLDLINYAGKQIIDISLCGLGQAAPVPILSLVENYRDEFLAHIREHRCPAGQCPIDATVMAGYLTPGVGRTLDDPYRIGREMPAPLPLVAGRDYGQDEARAADRADVDPAKAAVAADDAHLARPG